MRFFPLKGVRCVLPLANGTVYAVAGGWLWRLDPGGTEFVGGFSTRRWKPGEMVTNIPKTATYADLVEDRGRSLVGVRAVGTVANPWWRGYEVDTLQRASEYWQYEHVLGGGAHMITGYWTVVDTHKPPPRIVFFGGPPRIGDGDPVTFRGSFPLLPEGEPAPFLLNYFTDGTTALVAVTTSDHDLAMFAGTSADYAIPSQVHLYAINLVDGCRGGPFPCFDKSDTGDLSESHAFAFPTTPGLVVGRAWNDYTVEDGTDFTQLRLWRPNDDCVELDPPDGTVSVFDVHPFDFQKIAISRRLPNRARPYLAVGNAQYAFDKCSSPVGARFAPDGMTLWYWTRNALVAFDVD